MIVKIAFLFLAFMGVLAMFGKLRVPRLGRQSGKRCRACGRPRIGKGRCPCGRA